MNIDYLKEHLNPEQFKAATHTNGPLLIVAGAGSGKTRIITMRIAHLMSEHSIDPRSILALTFTNKAANEMKERIAHFVKDSVSILPFIGTFHSYCLRFLKQHNDLLETPFLGILDEDDRDKLLQGIIKRHDLSKKMTAKQISYHISYMKNCSLHPEKSQDYNANPLMPEIYAAYEHEKKLSKCLDFDDLLLHTVKLLTAHPTLRKDYKEIIRHILVDEYQDTNVVQHMLLKCLALDEKNKIAIDSVCAVGDEDQSIYSWRGATVENIMRFKDDFKGTKIITIEQNYRSVQPILETANHVISHNKNRNPKSLWSSKAASDRIRIMACLSEYQEADVIIQLLKAVKARSKLLNTCAILYRSHFQSRALEEACIKHTIPYRIIGGLQFYERKEIKDILAYLKLINNPYDRIALFRIINCPLRGLGTQFEQTLADRWEKEPFLSAYDVIHASIKEGLVTGIKKQALEGFVRLFESRTAQESPSKVAKHIVNSTGYYTYLKDAYEPLEAQERIENVQELIEAMIHHEEQKPTTIATFLEEVALMQDKYKETSDQDHVTLMTLHAAKGLEFDTVIITGLEESILPSSRSLSDDDALEEERRLLYVGITRAQERLMITYARYRYSYGTMTDQRPSRFVQEIPSSHATAQDCSYWPTQQLYTHLSSWLGAPHKPEFSSVMTFSTPRPTVIPASPSKSATWKKLQPVMHPTFGTGIVQEIELKANQKTYLTIKFKSGTKKIAADFVKTT